MEKTTIYLPSDLHSALKDVSRRTGRPQADLIRDALREFLKVQPRPTLKSVGAGDDDSLTGRESEEWLRSRWDHA
jgi:predicted transcriptional regulator